MLVLCLSASIVWVDGEALWELVSATAEPFRIFNHLVQTMSDDGAVHICILCHVRIHDEVGFEVSVHDAPRSRASEASTRVPDQKMRLCCGDS